MKQDGSPKIIWEPKSGFFFSEQDGLLSIN